MKLTRRELRTLIESVTREQLNEGVPGLLFGALLLAAAAKFMRKDRNRRQLNYQNRPMKKRYPYGRTYEQDMEYERDKREREFKAIDDEVAAMTAAQAAPTVPDYDKEMDLLIYAALEIARKSGEDYLNAFGSVSDADSFKYYIDMASDSLVRDDEIGNRRTFEEDALARAVSELAVDYPKVLDHAMRTGIINVDDESGYFTVPDNDPNIDTYTLSENIAIW